MKPNQQTAALAKAHMLRLHPPPWYLERCNSTGVEVRDVRGTVVFQTEFDFGPEIGANLAEQITSGAKAVASYLVAASQDGCPECGGITGNGRGAWGYCSTCGEKTAVPGPDWKQQHEIIRDERAASFLRLKQAVGGVACTEYQAEVDLEIEARIKAVIEQLRSTNAEMFALVARFGEELTTDYRNRLLEMFQHNAASIVLTDRAANKAQTQSDGESFSLREATKSP